MPALNPASAEPALPTRTACPGVEDLAERCLRKNPYLALKNVSCDYRDGVLVLRGCLASYYLKQIAQEADASLEGIERIDNQIQVVTPLLVQQRADARTGTGEQ